MLCFLPGAGAEAELPQRRQRLARICRAAPRGYSTLRRDQENQIRHRQVWTGEIREQSGNSLHSKRATVARRCKRKHFKHFQTLMFQLVQSRLNLWFPPVPRGAGCWTAKGTGGWRRAKAAELAGGVEWKGRGTANSVLVITGDAVMFRTFRRFFELFSYFQIGIAGWCILS